MFRYRVRLEEISTLENPGSFEFEATNHDDLLRIVQTVQQGGMVEGDDVAAVIVGLKLLMEVVLKRRRDPLFAPLEAPLGNFIKALKKGRANERTENEGG